MTALHDVKPTPPFVRGRVIPTETTDDNGIGRMRAYTELDPRVRFMSAFPVSGIPIATYLHSVSFRYESPTTRDGLLCSTETLGRQ